MKTRSSPSSECFTAVFFWHILLLWYVTDMIIILDLDCKLALYVIDSKYFPTMTYGLFLAIWQGFTVLFNSTDWQ